MNPPPSLLQRLVLPAMVAIMMATGFLIFKKNPEIMSQNSLLSVLNENAQENELQFQTSENRLTDLQTPTPNVTPPHHMTVRLREETTSTDPNAGPPPQLLTDRFSAFLQGPALLAHDNTTILALDAMSGRLMWKFELPPSTQLAPGRLAVIGSEVVAGTDAGGLYAFRFSTGQLLWYWQEAVPMIRMPLVYSDKLLLFRSDKKQSWRVARFDPSKQRIMATYDKFDSQLTATPLVSGNLLIFSTDDGHLQAVDLTTRKTRWSTEGSSNFSCPPVQLGERIYICNEDGYILGYDRKNGRHAGQVELGSKAISPVVLTDAVSIATTIDTSDNLIAFDLKKQKRLWKYSLVSADSEGVPREIMLTHESLKALNYVSPIRGWSVWASCHSSKICIFDLKAGQLLHRIDAGYPLIGNFLLAREDVAWVPVRSGHHVMLERWSKPSKPVQ